MLAIIGGTGLYDLAGMQIQQELSPDTPFGRASGPVLQGRLHGHELLFLARHGAGHRLLPHEVNYRANVFALKRAGATQILGFSAVGSLAEAVAPGDLAMPSQYFDWTRGRREQSFFGHGVAAHVSTAMPVSDHLVELGGNAGQGARPHAAHRPHLRLRRRPAPGHARREPLHARGRLPPGGHDQRARGLSRSRGADLLCDGGPGHRLRLLDGRSLQTRERERDLRALRPEPGQGAPFAGDAASCSRCRPRSPRSARRCKVR